MISFKGEPVQHYLNGLRTLMDYPRCFSESFWARYYSINTDKEWWEDYGG